MDLELGEGDDEPNNAFFDMRGDGFYRDDKVVGASGASASGSKSVSGGSSVSSSGSGKDSSKEKIKDDMKVKGDR